MNSNWSKTRNRVIAVFLVVIVLVVIIVTEYR